MMKKIHLTCNYCDHKWTETVYPYYNKDKFICTRCKDKNVKITYESDSKNDIFGYDETPQEDAYIKRD